MDVKKYDDIDLQENIEFLSEKLHLSVQDLSSFDEYVTEVRLVALHPSFHLLPLIYNFLDKFFLAEVRKITVEPCTQVREVLEGKCTKI